MFKKLLPKEEKYFDDFKEMINYIGEMAKYTNEIFSQEVIDRSLLLKIKPLEVRCDEITSKIVKRLNKTFVTPFDREDIFTLIQKLDDVSDLLLDISERLDAYHITSKMKFADRLAAIVLEQIKELGTAIQDLKVKSINECKAVKDLEKEADGIYQQAMKELFDNEKDAITLIKRKEILELLEEASDQCQAVAKVVLSIFIKNN